MSQVARKKTRKFLFQKLYARLFWEVDEKLFHAAFFEGIFEYSVDTEYLDQMYQLVVDNESYCLHILQTYAPKFDTDTMNKANILSVCIGICEMRFLSDSIPAKVSLNEAVEIAKTYGDTSSGKIVNGILNSYYKNLEKHQEISPKNQSDSSIFS